MLLYKDNNACSGMFLKVYDKLYSITERNEGNLFPYIIPLKHIT